MEWNENGPGSWIKNFFLREKFPVGNNHQNRGLIRPVSVK